MKKRKGMTLRKICGEDLIIADGTDDVDFSNLVSLTPSAAYLWREVGDGEFDNTILVRLLTEEYDVDEATAKADACELAKSWLEAGLVEN